MYCIINLLFIITSVALQLVYIQCDSTTEDNCFNQVYRDCMVETTFTTIEIQTTQLYLQRRFGGTSPVGAACPISADKPPCIRKDIKCLTAQEIETLTSAWVKLYENGVIGNFTKIHNDYWGSEHKFTEGPLWHFWFINKLEKELQKIDASICMPYWNSFQDFAHPENSIVWDIFGHAGNESNDYCVPDGPFANITCTFPTNHCLRRQWRISPALDPWKSSEYFTMTSQLLYNSDIMNPLLALNLEQTSETLLASITNLLKYAAIVFNPTLSPYAMRVVMKSLVAHFDTHLSCGGYNGDMSIPIAPCDPIFHIFHIMAELDQLLWQLSNSNDLYLVPKSYNGGIRYNNASNTRTYCDIDFGTFNYYDESYIKEGFQFGFGEMCHLYDVIIKPINNIVDQNLLLEAKYPLTSWLYTCVPELSPPLPSLPTTATLPKLIRPLCSPGPLPVAAQRLKDCLSPELFTLYFPKFASNNWSFFDHVFFNISADCNAVSDTCRTMPFALPFNATAEGVRQYQAFNASVADMDVTSGVNAGQDFYQKFMDDLNNCGYCSPYV